MEEWQEDAVQRWESERTSRPTAAELENWERTVADIRVRYKLAEDRKLRAELCHRLATSYIKMEEYAQAMAWVDIGLEEGAEEWKNALLDDKAISFYLSGDEAGAFAILEGLQPIPEAVAKAEAPKRKTPDPWREDALNLLCPHCSAEVAYGQSRCPGCGAKVDENFKLVRSEEKGLRDGPSEGAEMHRIKKFSILLTDYTVDYDDPMNFLTAHRVRFMGGEMVTVTEREWYTKIGLLVLGFLYLVFGLLIWRAATVVDVSIGPLVALIFMVLVIILPFTLLYLNVVVPGLFGGTYPVDVRGLSK